MREKNRQDFDEFSSVYSNEFRVFTLENQLRLTKKYVRDLVGYSEQLIDYVSNLHHNQKLL